MSLFFIWDSLEDFYRRVCSITSFDKYLSRVLHVYTLSLELTMMRYLQYLPCILLGSSTRSPLRYNPSGATLVLVFLLDCRPMASEPETIKHRRYDPSMSKRTRKPQVVAEISVNQDDELAEDSNSIHSSSVSSLIQEDELFKVSNGIHNLSLSSLDQQDELLKVNNGIHQSSPRSPDQGDELQNDRNCIYRSSLKELMNQGNGQEKVSKKETDQVDDIGGDIRAAMSEAKSSLALVPVQGDDTAGNKKRGMVSRYVKVLSHLIKVKRESKKKYVVPLLKR